MKLPFALKDNEIVSINDVVQGIACNCICPSCESKLIAVKGEYTAHHFRHYKNPECKHGYETALHLAAKKVLEQSKRVILPNFYYHLSNYGYQEIIEKKV